MLTNVDSSVFLNSNSIELQPIVSAEWNHNLFNTPYMTVAGTGTLITPTISSGSSSSINHIGVDSTIPGFDVYAFYLTIGQNTASQNISYTASSLSCAAYKIVTYVKTTNPTPILVNCYAKGSSTQYGSQTEEVNSYGWTKIETYVGGQNSSDIISSLIYTINANSLDSDMTPTAVYYTIPEIYQTTFFDYQYHSMWPTESAFTYFRPGESYVPSGNTNITIPSQFRKVNSTLINNGPTTYTPVSSIIQNPNFTITAPPVALLKNALPSEMSTYKYFVSDNTTRQIAAMYSQNINTNKIVIKFNTLITVPTFNLYIDGSIITVDGSTSITPTTNDDGVCTGVVTLYWTGTAWTKTRWSTMPHFDSTGVLTTYTSFKKISITQIYQTINSSFSSYSNSSFTADSTRMQLIELSPRLEIDLTDFVKDVNINKSLDSKNNFVPISSINADDATINLSAIPISLNNGFVPIFSSQSNLSTNVLSNMLRKNIKLYINWKLKSYVDPTGFHLTSTIIPAGIFYSDSWDETDIKDVKIVAFDITRYLQTTAVSDYVGSLKPVFDVITNMLDLSGFTDYDVDSLYQVCTDKATPLDLAYFYTNGRDTTIVDTLAEIFLAYQIGAYIDEYGIMKFKSLSQILNNQSSTMIISESSIHQGGYTVVNKAKPGKISLRYQSPKIKQSAALQNASDPAIKNSPSFIYTTSNDIMWSQETTDSVGFNYLYSNMAETDSSFSINQNDFLDLFHTFTLNSNGYAVIENELVSFVYKEYTLSNSTNSVTVSVKNDLELSSEINKFTKKYATGLVTNWATVTSAVGNGTSITFTASNNFVAGQKVSVSGTNPSTYTGIGKITSANANSFTVKGTTTAAYVSGGEAVVSADYDVVVTPTGRITNVQRGQFGTVPSSHTLITSLGSKGLLEASINSSNVMSAGGSKTTIKNNKDFYSKLPSVKKILVTAPPATKCLVYPSTTDLGYKTYSVKFDFDTGISQQMGTAGLFFNNNGSTTEGSYFVELLFYNQINNNGAGPFYTVYNPPKYQWLVSVSKMTGGTLSQIAWADVTGTINSIQKNFEKVFVKGTNTYSAVSDNVYHLRATHWTSDGTAATNSLGEDSGELLKVFLNNIQITGWNVPGGSTNSYFGSSTWTSLSKNAVTSVKKNIKLSSSAINTTGTYFGYCTSTYPFGLIGYHTVSGSTSSSTMISSVREIYACEKPLIERSVNYWYQDREFLNGLVQKQNIFGKYKNFIIQTNPEIVGLNVYDVQYTNPAAVTVDSYWGGYLMQYYPGPEVSDQGFKQAQIIDEYGLAFSTPLNTGFRAKMAVTNNSNQMVYLSRKPDSNIQVDSRFTLWTHEIIGPSDPQILEKITDRSNITEVAQVDSIWIQSPEAASKLLSVIQKGFEGFSKDTTIQIFGNPLIQVGDVITVNYSLSKINQQKYAVHSVTHAFNQGLKTTLVLNQVDKGITY
jgi:hypothetical protein